ncbi:MAG TPA: alpha/beta hydrolase [Trichocoleus sp.]|jgi:predicted dienelactone hydrolase
MTQTALLVKSSQPARPFLWLKPLLGLALFPLILSAGAAWSADRLTISYGLLERSISLRSLQIYAREGKIEKDLRTYTQFLDAEQEAQLRQILQVRAKLSPVAVSQFLYTEPGERLLDRLSQVVRTESNLPGFYALRAALILAAADPQGLTPLNVLEQFPLSDVRIDLSRTLRILSSLEELIRQTQNAIALVEMQSAQEASTESTAPFAVLPDLRRPGSFSWQKSSFQLTDAKRDRTFPVDLYLPYNRTRTPVTAAPLIVISHGLGSERGTYAYLARQLASYGFAVAVPEHPGSNASQLQALISGSASEVTNPQEFIDRPLDIKYLLDELSYRNQTDPRFRDRMDFQRVGVIGQSLGAYTALALAGAKINFAQLSADCGNTETFNLSLLLQCRAQELTQPLPDLKDDRVKAIIVINPIGSSLLGQPDYASIQIPVMLMSGSADTVSPSLMEQIIPFTWLTTPNKYLVLLSGGTHFSTLSVTDTSPDRLVRLPSQIVGPNPILAQTYLKSLGVAFFQTYVANQPGYLPYLQAAYAQLISNEDLPLTLIRSFTPAQVAQILRNQPAPAPTPQSTSSR